MSRGSIWQTLGIARTTDRAEIRRAYARKLKETNPEDDPEGFQALRAAYDHALASAGAPGRHAVPPPFLPDFQPESRAVVRKVRRPPAEADPVPAPPEAPAASDDEPAADAVQPLPLQTAAETAPAPPPPPPDPRIEHARLQEALARLLRRKTVDEDMLLKAYNAVVTSPAMDFVDVYAATEDWLAFVIATQIPTSDPLIGPAMKRFGWSDRSLLRRDQFHIQHMQRRLSDLVFLRDLKLRRGPHHGAYRILTQPFKPVSLAWRLFSPATPGRIAELIATIRSRYPSLIADLDRDTVEQWEAWHGKGTRISPWGLWALIMTPLCIAMIAADHLLLPEAVHAISLLLIIPPAFAATALFNYVALGRARPLWELRGDKTSYRQRFGWALILLATIAVAAIPNLPMPPLPVAILGCAGAVWARAVSDVDGKGLNWWLSTLFADLLLISWSLAIALSLSIGEALQFLAAALTTLVIGIYGSAALHRLYKAQPLWFRISAVATAVLASLGAVTLLVVSDADKSWRITAVSAVLAGMTLFRPLVTQVRVLGPRLRVGISLAMIIWTLGIAPKEISLIGGAVWVVWNLVRAITELRKPTHRA